MISNLSLRALQGSVGNSKYQKWLCLCTGFEVQNSCSVSWHIYTAENERGRWLVWDQPLPIAFLRSWSKCWNRRLCRSLQVVNYCSTSLRSSIWGNRNRGGFLHSDVLDPQMWKDLLQYETITTFHVSPRVSVGSCANKKNGLWEYN